MKTKVTQKKREEETKKKKQEESQDAKTIDAKNHTHLHMHRITGYRN